MAFGIKLHVWGDYACFTRPEMKVERVSYDVITPSAARGILEAIHWKPAIVWIIDRIQVLKPIRFESIRRNEVASKISAAKVSGAMKRATTDGLYLVADEDRQQRASTVLRDVAYIIEAHFELTEKANSEESVGKHLDIFNRRARSGQCFQQPCFGTREFTAYFALIESNTPTPQMSAALSGVSKDLGWMLHDIDFANNKTAEFFRANMIDGVIEVPKLDSQAIKK